jgi:predicted nucleotidyltransferase
VKPREVQQHEEKWLELVELREGATKSVEQWKEVGVPFGTHGKGS